MKKIFKYFIPCVAAALGLVSCTNDEQGFVDQPLPGTIEVQNVTVVSYNTITADIALTNEENVLEQGLEVATKEDFSDATFVIADSVDTQVSMTLQANPSTTYYIRGYAFQKNSNILKTEVVTVTTPEYTYPVSGTYATTEIWAYDFDDGHFYSVMGQQYYPSYEFTIEEGENGEVAITNLYEFGTTVIGFYDEESGIIQVPGGQQVLASYRTYGPVSLVGFTDELDNSDYVTFYFDNKTGALESGFWGVRVSAGFIDIMAISAQQK